MQRHSETPIGTRASRKRRLADTDLEPAESMNPNPTRRHEATVGTMIKFLEHLRESKHPLKEDKKEPKPYRPKLRHNISIDIKNYVVFLRHGSLTDDSTICRPYREVSRIAGVKFTTAHKIVALWKANGFRVINRLLGHRNRAKW